MKHIVTVAKRQSAQQLIHKTFHHIHVNITVQTVEILFQILVTMFEDERQLFIGMQNIVQSNDVFMFQLLENGKQ